MYAEELGGRWKEIEIKRAYRLLKGDFYIDFKTPEEWKEYPHWAQDREKIMRRVYALFPDQL